MSATDTVDPRLLFARLRLDSARSPVPHDGSMPLTHAHTRSHTVRGDTHRLGLSTGAWRGASGEEGRSHSAAHTAKMGVVAYTHTHTRSLTHAIHTTRSEGCVYVSQAPRK